MAAESITFLALIAACHVLGHHFGRAGHRGHALASHLTGAALLLGDAWAMSSTRARAAHRPAHPGTRPASPGGRPPPLVSTVCM
jgi:hypothetical protein